KRLYDDWRLHARPPRPPPAGRRHDRGGRPEGPRRSPRRPARREAVGLEAGEKERRNKTRRPEITGATKTRRHEDARRNSLYKKIFVSLRAFVSSWFRFPVRTC